MWGDSQLTKIANCKILRESLVHGYWEGAIVWISQIFYLCITFCDSSIQTDICPPDTWGPVGFDSKEPQRTLRQNDTA